MGWDITYHPVGADEIRSIYFKGLADQEHYKTLVTQFAVNDFYAEQLRIRFEEARNIGVEAPFNKGHAYYVAIIFGFLRKHHYIRGGAFSFLADDRIMARYVGDWASLVPEILRGRKFENCLTENYSRTDAWRFSGKPWTRPLKTVLALSKPRKWLSRTLST